MCCDISWGPWRDWNPFSWKLEAKLKLSACVLFVNCIIRSHISTQLLNSSHVWPTANLSLVMPLLKELYTTRVFLVGWLATYGPRASVLSFVICKGHLGIEKRKYASDMCAYLRDFRFIDKVLGSPYVSTVRCHSQNRLNNTSLSKGALESFNCSFDCRVGHLILSARDFAWELCLTFENILDLDRLSQDPHLKDYIFANATFQRRLRGDKESERPVESLSRLWAWKRRHWIAFQNRSLHPPCVFIRPLLFPWFSYSFATRMKRCAL